ncbi:MAG: hypothetical protein ABEJ99_00760 [Candidatus Nanohaloarchaea archaeon]
METTSYILNKLKENFGGEDGYKYDEDGFPDMSYIVGNTSGMDVGNVPSPLDQRIGRMAQLGGSIMEVQITNPATFQIDRPEIINVVDRLDLDMTLHGDPNIGFTAAYATGGRVTGYNIVHRYFKRYLEQMAAFKYEVDERREKDELSFEVGYVNVHASNEMIPALEERLASDVSVDPFGYFITDIDSSGKKTNIYDNSKFLRKLFYFWFLEKVDRPWQFYENVFSDLSPEFNEAWKEAKEEAAKKRFEAYEPSIRDYEGVVQTVSSVDQGLDRTFLDMINDADLDNTIKIEDSDIESLLDDIDFEARAEEKQGDDSASDLRSNAKETLEDIFLSDSFRYEKLSDLQDLSSGGRRLLNNPRSISRDIYDLEKGNFEIPSRGGDQLIRQMNDLLKQRIMDSFEEIQDRVEDILHRIWEQSSSEAKVNALSRNLDIQRSEIFEEAESDPAIIDEAAPNAFSGSGDYADERMRNRDDMPPSYVSILQQLSEGRLSDEFNKESSIFFHIMPAWMMAAEEQGFKAPQFIWNQIVGRSDFRDYDEFNNFIQEDRENQLDVIAAVGACYIWGHFTQNPGNFNVEAFNDRKGFVPEHLEGKESVSRTWIQWMNEFGLKVNIEAMYGSPGELRRVWRPKDIAILCHAIDMTAKKQLGDGYENTMVKFTIDMEHTSSYGVDPVNEINHLIDQEKKLVDDHGDELGIKKNKPLSHIVKTYHLTKPGWEQSQGHRHGPFSRGDKTLYRWLYTLVEAGFTRDPSDPGIVMFEVGGEYHEEMYTIRVALNMIELGIRPQDLDEILSEINPGEKYENEKQALVARFFGLDKPNYNREWAKIEEHAFDPLKGLLEAEDFDYTYSGRAAMEEGGKRPQEWQEEQYR